jgi:hypothetical protein
MVIHLNAAGFVLGVVAEAAGGSSNRVGLGAVEGRHDEPADSRVGGSIVARRAVPLTVAI